MFAMAKRIFLFLMVNILVVLTISIVLSLLGVQGYISERGLNMESLAIFCLVWGMVGSFISLGLSRIMAKMAMGVKVIDPNTRDPHLQELVQSVHQLAQSAGLRKMPEVGIYDSPEPNAFATGPTKSRSLVAVSTGLLNRMNTQEVNGVLAHEVAHIANGDMVTMTLLQGVVNAFVMFLARVAAFAITNALSKNRDDDGRGMNMLVYHITVFVFEMILMLLGMMVVAAFSRYREFRADHGGARLGGRDNMTAALRALQRTIQIQDPAHDAPQVQAFKISSKKKSSLMALFSTHPPLEARIERLEMMTSI